MSQFMSRDSRKVIDLLGSLCSQKGVGQLITPMDIYSADVLVYRFFTPPITNILKMRLAQVRKLDSRHASVEYWVPVIVNMIKNNGSAQRPEWKPMDAQSDNGPCSIHWEIINYLIADYGYGDLAMLMNLIHTYTMDEVRYAISVGKSNRVYEIRYISAVLEKERAKKRMVDERREVIIRQAESSDRLLNEKIHERTILDMAQVEYNWKTTQENMRIQREFEEMLKGMDK